MAHSIRAPKVVLALAVKGQGIMARQLRYDLGSRICGGLFCCDLQINRMTMTRQDVSG